MNDRLATLEALLAEKELRIAQLEALVHLDPMTGLSNRQGFHEKAEILASHHSREGGSTFLLFLDVDDFKRLNTEFTHEGGDFALITLATRFKTVMRIHDIVARWSGDEFVIAFHLDTLSILNGVHRAIIDRLISIVREPIDFNGCDMNVTCSFGVVRYDGREKISMTELVKAADEAMYEAKHAGKDGTVELNYLPALAS